MTSYGPSEGWRPPQDDIISWGCFGDAVPEGLRLAGGFGEVDGNAHAACCAAVSATASVGIASSGPSEGLRPSQDDTRVVKQSNSQHWVGIGGVDTIRSSGLSISDWSIRSALPFLLCARLLILFLAGLRSMVSHNVRK